jgi:hypothetical protein
MVNTCPLLRRLQRPDAFNALATFDLFPRVGPPSIDPDPRSRSHIGRHAKHVTGNEDRNEGFVFQDSDRVILDEARMQQTHI